MEKGPHSSNSAYYSWGAVSGVRVLLTYCDRFRSFFLYLSFLSSVLCMSVCLLVGTWTAKQEKNKKMTSTDLNVWKGTKLSKSAHSWRSSIDHITFPSTARLFTARALLLKHCSSISAFSGHFLKWAEKFSPEAEYFAPRKFKCNFFTVWFDSWLSGSIHSSTWWDLKEKVRVAWWLPNQPSHQLGLLRKIFSRLCVCSSNPSSN